MHGKKELAGVFSLCRRENVPFMVMGGGSNILFSDKGFPGVIAVLRGEFTEFAFKGTRLEAGAGAAAALLVNKSLNKSLSGLELLAGVPGTLGGALCGNAGTKDSWIGSLVESVEILAESGTFVTLAGKDLSFGYRTSNLSGKIISRASLNLIKAEKNDILKAIDDLKRRRETSQPEGVFCAGSVFKNPSGESAARLIDAAGLKGLVFGGAAVSEKHANFIVNKGSATAHDVKTLIGIIHAKVKERFGVALDLEIKIIGE